MTHAQGRFIRRSERHNELLSEVEDIIRKYQDETHYPDLYCIFNGGLAFYDVKTGSSV